MFHRILVGVDDTPAARAALKQAVELVEAGHGRLGLLSCAPRPTMVGAAPTIMPITRAELEQELVKWAEGNLAAAEEAVPKEIPVTKLLCQGSPWRALLREARSGCWDLVVVGQTDRAWWPPFLARVGERLSRRSPTPVLVVHEQPREPMPARRRRLGRRRRRNQRRFAPPEGTPLPPRVAR
jgi:nucleotide-binding universal stress UspA family protein